MSEMIERVARAAFAAWRQRMIDTGERPDAMAMSFGDLDKGEREFAMIHARAVIAAMREPTAAMAWAANDAFPEAPAETTCRQIGETIWRAMIAAALGDDKLATSKSVPSLDPTPARGASSPESSLPESNSQSETP